MMSTCVDKSWMFLINNREKHMLAQAFRFFEIAVFSLTVCRNQVNYKVERLVKEIAQEVL